MSVREEYALDADFEAMEDDPYPTYAEWRATRPVGYLEPVGGWMLTTWDACEAVGKDEDRIDAYNASSIEYFGHNILNIGGEAHRGLRSAVDASLRPKAVRAYIERIARPVAREYVARVRERGRVDATTGLLELVSVRVVGNVMGLAELDDETLQRWFQHLNLGLTNNIARDPEVDRIASIAKQESADWSREALKRLEASPDETTFAHMLLTDTADGRPRSFEELIGTIWVIILGGFQEPGHAAAASLLGLLENRDQYEAVVADPSLVPASIHEGLRWISPFGLVQRRALADLEVEGVTIPAGDEINMVVASANHDESRYVDGGVFDLFRERQPVASFGYGAHFCAGHFLARELEKVVLEEMLVQLPNMRPDPEGEAKVVGFSVRGVKNLPIVWDA